jgi:orotidine-5'-phosphate decarboxylase
LNFRDKITAASDKNQSLLCVGLDPDLEKIPAASKNDPAVLFAFNRVIIEATKDFVCAYKPNMAFYEQYGLPGLEALLKTISFIQSLKIPVILDGKRGDIGNTSAAYARSAFEFFKADAVTVAPYMGYDSLSPFLEYKDKGVFVLCLTSNAGSADFQTVHPEKPLYKIVAEKVRQWNKYGNCGLVVGATKPEELKDLRKIAPDLPFLIPGVGTQGGDLETCVKTGGENIIINASRSIIYAAEPGKEAQVLRDAINKCKVQNSKRKTKE